MQKLFFSFLVTCLLSAQASFAQSYILSGVEKTDKEDMQYEVLGKVANNYWIYKKNGNLSTIAQYNAQMQLVKQNDLAFLPASVSSIEFIVRAEKVFAFYQFQNKTTVFAAAAEINADGQLVGNPKIIDTAENIRPGSNVKVFNLLQSDDRNKLAIFSVNTTHEASIKVKMMSLNSNFELVNEAAINVNAKNKKSNLSDFALDNAGNLFCLRNMTLENAAPAVSLLYLAADGSEVVESSILNNTLLLDDIRLKVDNVNGRVLLTSFYAMTKKGNIEGLYTYMWDINTKKELLSNAARFTDALRAAVSSKRNLKAVFDHYYIDRMQVQTDGSITVVAERAETNGNRNFFSRWDYFYGGPFYSPFMFNYWNRPFGFYPWTRFGLGFGFGYGLGFGFGMSPFMWGPWMNPYAGFGYNSVTYSADKVAFVSIDTKGAIQSIKTIDKRQSDFNTDQFIGYGTVDNNNGTSFVYQKKEKGVSQFVLNTITKEGQLVKGENIILAEKKYEWMPRSLKQVGENEAIVPYQYKDKIGFAKIQIK
jgi:hypothetical protein